MEKILESLQRELQAEKLDAAFPERVLNRVGRIRRRRKATLLAAGVCGMAALLAFLLPFFAARAQLPVVKEEIHLLETIVFSSVDDRDLYSAGGAVEPENGGMDI